MEAGRKDPKEKEKRKNVVEGRKTRRVCFLLRFQGHFETVQKSNEFGGCILPITAFSFFWFSLLY